MLGLELVVVLGVAVLLCRIVSDRLRLRTISLREIRRDPRGIILVSTVLVIVTAWAVAAVAHGLRMPWVPAWVLGAAVAPTDATAVEVVARLLPRRNLTLLRAESLINDGTALVVYGLAVGITVGEEHFSVPRVGGLFLLSYAGGAAAGAPTAGLAALIRPHVPNPVLGTTVVVLVPFTAFLLAEAVAASGVLADLVGIGSQSAVRGLNSTGLAHALIAVAAVSATLVVVRFGFTFLAVRVIRLLDRRPRQRLRRMNERARVVGALSGFRGAVSLAVALSVPTSLDSGAPFPDRDTIIFVTVGVIAVTLIGQGLLLPAVVRWARLPQDTTLESERLLADTTVTEEALKALPRVAAELGTDPDVTERLRDEYETHLITVRTRGSAADEQTEPVVRHVRHYTALRLALLTHKRATVIRLRDEHRIDDTVLETAHVTTSHSVTSRCVR
ncbi:cation:proton antiporter [Streptomyces sp. NPDC020192]|uniref:cation:proton antiporter domain-containing protein n=1 Tax=Streptomyces sp. NPDC020192 TaxID=3365066 RepID=UPI0037BAC99E